MTRRVGHVVIGLGALGSAAAWHLASRGEDVLGLEQFALGHARGASHDTSRILRHSYHTPAYAELTKAAYDDWAALEAATGETFVTVAGGLDLFPPDPGIPMSDYTDSMTAAGIPFEVLSREEIGSRWPAFTLPQGTVGLFQERGAIVPAGRATAAMQRLATSAGADLHDEEPVLSVTAADGAYVVETAAATYLAGSVVVCADAWTNRVLAGLGVEVPLTVTLEQVTYFRPERPEDLGVGLLPVWIWMDEPCYYGFPTYGEGDGQATVKAAQDCGGPPVDPDDRTFDPDPEMEARLAAHVAATIPGAGPPVRSLRCQYTLTRDRDFVLAPVPGHENVVVGLGAAHGFKFAPTFGRLLADLAVTGTTDADLAAFRFDRPGITDPDYAEHWMV